MSEETEGVAEVPVEETTDPAAVAVEEAPEKEAVAVDEAPEDDPVAVDDAEAPAHEPADERESEAPELEAVVPEIDAVVSKQPVPQAAPGRREAQLYLCERGHRTLILWGDPPVTCNARKTRNEVCGLTLYHSTELPEQVQKALNPIKASKKKSGKK
jgi:hypothetical protein